MFHNRVFSVYSVRVVVLLGCFPPFFVVMVLMVLYAFPSVPNLVQPSDALEPCVVDFAVH